MGNSIAMALMKVSLSTSVILAFLLLLSPLFGKRYPARWRYFTWLAVSIRLLIPLAFTFPEAPVQISVPQAMLTSERFQTLEESPMPVAPVDSPPVEISPAGDSNLYSQTDTASIAEAPLKAKVPTPIRLAVGIWLAGMLVFFSIQVLVYIRFIRKVHYSPRSEVSAFIRDKWWETGKELGIVRLPMIAVCQCVPSPILAGLLRPKLLLPHDRYSPEEISFILRHELVHFRRRDLWYKLVLMVANGFHWFNPLVYLMAIQAGRDAELSCDDEVTAGYGDDERAAYGNTILAALPRKGRIEPVLTTSFRSTKTSIKLRLKNLFDHRTKRSGITALCSVILCMVVACGFFAYVPVSAAAVETDKQEYSIENKFARYKEYGLVYNKTAETLTYNGERVEFFFDFQNDTQRAFDIFWSDGKTSNALYLQGTKDANGRIAGIKVPDDKTLREVLEGYNGGLGGLGGLSDKPADNNPPPTVYTMDATYQDVANSIVATDKINKAALAANIKNWLEQCDKKTGAYIFKQPAGEGFDTYIYYNAGGRYPWNLEVDENDLRIDLYGNNDMVTGEGYYLMHFTSPKNYENIQVYLDGKALKTGTAPLAAVNVSTTSFGNATGDNGVISGQGEQKLPLVNTQSYPLTGIESIHISYLADNITILEGEKDRIEFKEYMSVSNKNYYAQVTLDGSKISIDSGERPKQDSLESTFPSHLVLYLPKSYHGALSIESVNAAIYSDVSYALNKLNAASTTGKVEFYNLSAEKEIIAHVTSGKVIFHDISADSIKLSNTAGSITVHQAVGNIDIKSTDGDINFGVPEAMSFQFQASAIGSNIKTYFDEQTIKIKDGDKITVFATVGQRPDLTVNISTTSGNIRVDKR